MTKPTERTSEIKQLLLSLVGNAPFGIITIGLRDEVTLINEPAAEILNISGTSLKKVLDVPVLQFFPENCEFRHSFKLENGMSNLHYDVMKDCIHGKYVDVKVRPFISGRMITLEDRTDAVLAEEQAKRSIELETKNKELEQFAYISSHDLKEPLNTILGVMQLIDMQFKEGLDDKMSKYLKMIQTSAERMTSQINGLLEYSRIGRQTTKSEVDMNEVVAEVLEGLANQISSKCADVKVAQLPLVFGSKEELMSLMRNLISNAIKYVAEDVCPKITIGFNDANGGYFFVQDNGIGIDEQHHEKVFMMYQRLHNRSQYEGDGIGLAHCHKIVEFHEGSIWLESKLGHGSTFCFKLNAA